MERKLESRATQDKEVRSSSEIRRILMDALTEALTQYSREIVFSIDGFKDLLKDLARETKTSGIDQNTLESFQERFNNIIEATAQQIKTLQEELAQFDSLGDLLSDLIGDETEEKKAEAKKFEEIKKLLSQHAEKIRQFLEQQAEQKEREAAEIKEKEDFVKRLTFLSGVRTQDLLLFAKNVDASGVDSFIAQRIQKAEGTGEDNNDILVAAKKEYEMRVQEIERKRELLSTNFVPSDSLALAIRQLGLNPPDFETVSVVDNDIVSRLRSAGKFDVAVERVKNTYQKELDAFLVSQNTLLDQKLAEVETQRDTSFRNAIESSLTNEDIVQLMQEQNISCDRMADEFLYTFTKRPEQLTEQEILFLPKQIMDRLVARLTDEQVSMIIHDRTALFYSESFGEKLRRMRGRYVELAQPLDVQMENFDRDVQNPNTPLGKLFKDFEEITNEMYKEQGNVSGKNYTVYNRAVEKRNELFRGAIEQIVEKIQLFYLLSGQYKSTFKLSRNTVSYYGEEQSGIQVGDGKVWYWGDQDFGNHSFVIGRQESEIDGKPVHQIKGALGYFNSKAPEFNRPQDTLSSFRDIISNLSHFRMAGRMQRESESIRYNQPLTEENIFDMSQIAGDDDRRSTKKETAQKIVDSFVELDTQLPELRARIERVTQGLVTLTQEINGEINNSESRITDEMLKGFKERNVVFEQEKNNVISEIKRILEIPNNKWGNFILPQEVRRQLLSKFGYQMEQGLDYQGNVISDILESNTVYSTNIGQALSRGGIFLRLSNEQFDMSQKLSLLEAKKARQDQADFVQRERSVEKTVGEQRSYIETKTEGILGEFYRIFNTFNFSVGFIEKMRAALVKNQNITFGTIFRKKQQMEFVPVNADEIGYALPQFKQVDKKSLIENNDIMRRKIQELEDSITTMRRELLHIVTRIDLSITEINQMEDVGTENNSSSNLVDKIRDLHSQKSKKIKDMKETKTQVETLIIAIDRFLEIPSSDTVTTKI